MYSLGIIGYPLSHSLSPRIHAAALRALNLSGEYQLYPVPPLPEGSQLLEDLLIQMRRGDLHGLNVTIPHKQSVLHLLDGLTSAARAIGAVNTIFLSEGNLLGDNTDAPGFARDLRRVFQFSQEEVSEGRNALVLGAGGSARAVVYSLLQEGWHVVVAARRLLQAQDLISELQSPAKRDFLNAITMEQPAIRELLSLIPLTLIINATPLGMSPNTDVSPWPLKVPLPPQGHVYDLVYDPSETVLVSAAHAAGLPATNGLGMLVEQAALAFERWTGFPASRESIWRAVS